MASPATIVVGGAGGIGRSVCDALAPQGRPIAVCDVDLAAASATAGALAAGGATAIAVAIDVSSGASVDAAFAAVREQLGPVGILVNAAGWDDFVPFVDTDEAFWDRIIQINYTGVLRTCHAALPDMIEAGNGRIVNVASDAGRVGSSMETVYAGAKGAVIAFTKSLAREVASSGITANSVCPGPTDTPLIRGMAERMSSTGGDGDRFLAGLSRAIPMRRMADPADVATAVAYFAGDTTGYITGQTLSVSGGLTMC